MKLSAHYNKASIIITISVLIIGAVVYFFTIKYIARSQLDNNLVEEVDGIRNYIKLNHQLPKQVDFDEDLVLFKPTNASNAAPRFFDTTYVNPKEKILEPGRAICCVLMQGKSAYLTTLILSREDVEYLVQIIGIITLALSLGLLIILFLTNRYILNGLWQPFYRTLAELRSFSISDNRKLELNSTNVDEFNELNEAVKGMSFKVKRDFQNLKQYTENASHEMQTPLAAITAKLDTLIQEDLSKPAQYDQIHDIYIATNKLSKLNQTLLLLVKIENNLIDDTETLQLQLKIENKIKQFNELCLDRQITVNADLAPKEIKASRFLIDILLNNLFSNAIKHNVQGGRIDLTLLPDKLLFQNTGLPPMVDPERIFERFIKGQKSEGTGLGLALVKNICNLNGWQISYHYEDPLHTFEISFN